MKKQRINILTKVIVIFLFLVLLSCSSTEKKSPGIKTAVQNIPDQKIWDMDVLITNSGKVNSKFRAGLVVRNNLGNSKYSEFMVDSGLQMIFYENEEQTGELNSLKGSVNDLKGIYKAVDSVVFKSQTGYVLYTDTLTWLRRDAAITTDSPVMMVRNEQDTLYGDGFFTDEKFESYEIKNPRGRALLEVEDIE